MLSPMLNGLLLPFLVAMFLAINMGGSGTSPAFATAYGSGILRKDLIPGLFGLCVLVGALLAGKNTAVTLGKGILPAESLNYTLTTIILFSVALSLLFANLLGVPQSTSQSTVLALAAPAYYLDQLNVRKVFWEIIPMWVVLPIISFGIMYLIATISIKRFDSKHPGDIIQRIGDHHRIESFLTGTALNTFFSIINLVIFSFVLLSYNLTIFIIFAVGSFLYLGWIQFFLRYRRKLDYQRFAIASKENNATMQLVYGMQEIKLNNAENTYRWAWEALQAGLFKLNFKSLSLNQYQQIGAFFINQGKNIFITFVVAKLVIAGQLTLGMMLAIQYIIGQLNSPIEQLIGFTQQAQDAKISLERLNDIHALDDEELANKEYNHALPADHSIHIKNLSFTYQGAGNEPVLKNINLQIPQGKVTAIVGMSGSGKTTLVKLLLRFYDSYTGEIQLGNTGFKSISPKYWRSISGTVMQDSFIFNDNIRKNITVTDDKVDMDRLMDACKTANILPFIETLPLGFYTKLGAEGNGISGGQKQRLSIARAVYKNPKFIFFDEATNSLDANNEKVILENLDEFFKNRTVIIVAHRLSTVKHADKIIVLENGAVAEEGTHAELIEKKGNYFELVKNQLELGAP